MAEKKPDPPAAPVGLALIVCDGIYVDSSGRQALVGLFNQIVGPPSGVIVHPHMCVYASVTEIYPGTVFALDIVHGETEHAVVHVQSDEAQQSTNPAAIRDILFEFNNLLFRETGTYFVRVRGNGRVVLQRPIQVVRAVPPL